MLESLSNKIARLQLSCEYCKIFKNRFFHITPPMAASEKAINLPAKHQWRRRIYNLVLDLIDLSF